MSTHQPGPRGTVQINPITHSGPAVMYADSESNGKDEKFTSETSTKPSKVVCGKCYIHKIREI